ncbi:MAG: hypothetical protein ACT4PV_02320 [Planctomycetaceae bacterium]
MVRPCRRGVPGVGPALPGIAVSRFLRAPWTGAGPSERLRARLRAVQGDHRWHLIRVLRHLVADPMGRASWSEFGQDPDRWTAAWLAAHPPK